MWGCVSTRKSMKSSTILLRMRGSLNGQVHYLIQQCIRAFEKEHGPIDLEDKP